MNQKSPRPSRGYQSRVPQRPAGPQARRPGASQSSKSTPAQTTRTSAPQHRPPVRNSRASKRTRQQLPLPSIVALLLVLIGIFLIVLLPGRQPGPSLPQESGSSSSGDSPSTPESETDPEQSSESDASQTNPESSFESSPSESDTSKESEESADLPSSPSLPTVSFTADLSAYEQYMNPQGPHRDAYLVLVNASHMLTANDNPTDLIDVSATREDGRNMQKMREYAAKALEALFLEADALGHINNSTGYPLSVTSAYRSYSYQEYLFNSYVDNTMSKNPGMTREEAENKVLAYSCRAGTSEHQTGLCADLHNQASASSSHPERFANTPEGAWVIENAWKFGFVLRFPEDKTDVTGITYESWHFRYVGRYHAYRMKEANLCLEEYVELLASEA